MRNICTPNPVNAQEIATELQPSKLRAVGSSPTAPTKTKALTGTVLVPESPEPQLFDASCSVSVEQMRNAHAGRPRQRNRLEVTSEGVALVTSCGSRIWIDAVDYESVSGLNWHIHKGKKTNYACSTTPEGVKVLMHRMLCGFPDGMVDHRDGNGLNNRRSNLRECTATESMRNRGCWNRSGLKGITFMPSKNLWRASISDGKRRISLGCYRAPEDAARAYDEAAKKYHGGFARLNFPG